VDPVSQTLSVGLGAVSTSVGCRTVANASRLKGRDELRWPTSLAMRPPCTAFSNNASGLLKLRGARHKAGPPLLMGVTPVKIVANAAADA
jgi:hypothetical protein